MSQTDAFLYFDADVLDDAIVAVDFQLPAALPGLRSKGALSAAMAHPKAVGMEIMILNPRLDADGNGLSALMHMLPVSFRANEKTFFNELMGRSLIRSRKENPRRLS
jgi:arginase family enzyme